MEIILSSAKRGYGLKELMSSKEDEYWNSDDVLPHSITISFFRKTYVYSVNVFLSYSLDESYTPEKIIVYFDEQGIVREMTEINSKLDLKTRSYTFKEPEGEKSLMIDSHVYKIHIVILNNHSDGKDSHLRKLRVMSSPTEQINYDIDKFF